MTEFIWSSAASLAKMIRNREVSSKELVNAHLQRIEAVNPALNAVVQIAAQRALTEARELDKMLAKGQVRGPLHGVPITIKDSLDTEGIITTWGTEGRRSFIPDKDAPVVARLRRAGAIILGKTNTSELSVGGEMDNPVYGPTYHPYDLSKSPSGSSGGAAAIIAAGGSPLDLGSDTGGSIRSPAHVCGIAGIKPTYGRTPITGNALPYGLGAVDTLTQIGPMARYVEDLILSLPIICGPDGKGPSVVREPMRDLQTVRLENLRVAFYTDGGIHPPNPEISKIVCHTATTLADEAASVTEAAPPALSRAEDLYPWLRFADGGRWIRRQLRAAGTSIPGPHVARLLNEAKSTRVPDLSTVLQELADFHSDMLRFIQGYDVILCPPDVYPALPHGGLQEGYSYRMWAHMSAYNLTGWPAGVVRAGQTAEGLPVGVQVVGQPWREDVVLAVMQSIETAFGGYRRPDPV